MDTSATPNSVTEDDEEDEEEEADCADAPATANSAAMAMRDWVVFMLFMDERKWTNEQPEGVGESQQTGLARGRDKSI